MAEFDNYLSPGRKGHLIGIGGGWVSSVILAIAGSCLVVWIARKFSK